MRAYLILFAVVGLAGWLFLNEFESRVAAEQALANTEQALKEVNAEFIRQKEKNDFDQQLIAGLEIKRREQERQSRESQLLTKQELKDDACSVVMLPGSTSERLQQRIHRQANKYAGTSPG